MSDLLPEDAWIKEFQTANSRPLLSSLQRRLAASTTHVQALAELYRERALIEQEYSTKLGKLARAAESGQLLGKGGVEWDRHGGEAKLWDAVLSDVQETASAHSNLAATLKSDFEAPIRDLPSKIVPWRRIHDQEGSLDRALKDYDRLSAKLEKTKKQNKIAELQDEIRNAQNTIASLTPMVYTTYQRIDEERLRGLKEVCVRWVTGRADVAAREGQRAEQAAAGLLSWEPQDEVVAVGVRLGSAAGGSGPRPSGVETPQTSTPPRRMSTATAGTGTSEFTPRMQRANGSSTNVNQPEKHGAFGGIKSMLARRPTVAGRQRSGSETTSVRSNRRAPGGDNFEQMGDGQPTDRQGGTPTRERPDPIPEAPTSSREPSGTQHSRTPQVDAEGYTIAPADRHRPLWEEPNESIPSRARTKSMMGSGTGAAAGAAAVALPSAILAAGQRSSSPAQIHDNQSTDSGSIAEAPNRLNLAMAQAPIEESEAERKAALAKMQQTLAMAPQPPTRRSTIARGRREARHTMQASANEAGPVPAVHMAALARMGDEERLADESTLSPARPDITRRRSTSSMSSGNPFDSPGLSARPSALEPSSAPILDQPSSARQGGLPTGAAAGAGVAAGGLGAAGAVLAAQHTGASARSGANGTLPSAAAPAAPFTASPVAGQQSLPVTESQASTAPISSATMPTGIPGLRASITETVHALMRQNQLLRTVVNGEIRLSLAPTPDQPLPPAGSAIHIRLTEFDALESIAPNPAFLAQVPDSPGEYYLDTGKVAQATARPEDPSSPQGPVLFRYQVLIPEGSEGNMAPVILNPAFQIKDGETRMILHYRVAPNSGVSGLNLAVAFPSEPEVTTTQSKPVTGVWSNTADGSRAIKYSVAPPEGVDNKIIARFISGGHLAPYNIDAHFVCPGRLLSSIGIETVDDAQALSGWSFANINRAVVSGKYIGEPSVNP